MSVKLHLGCGSNIIPGWVNLDSSPQEGASLWNGPKIPFEDESVDFIFSEHFLEHLSREEGHLLFRYCARALKPGGVMRISTPNLRTIVNDYLTGFWSYKYQCVGFEPNSGADFVNESFRGWGHQFIYDECELSKLGFVYFSSFYLVPHRDSVFPDLRNLECRPDLGDLMMEFKK